MVRAVVTVVVVGSAVGVAAMVMMAVHARENDKEYSDPINRQPSGQHRGGDGGGGSITNLVGVGGGSYSLWLK